MNELEKVAKKGAKSYEEVDYNVAFNGYEIERSFYDGFIAGAEWQAKQSPWICVEERLPKENTGVFFCVKWKDGHYGYFVGMYYTTGYWESDHRVFLPNSPLGKVTHWIPITLIDYIPSTLQQIKEEER